MSITAFTTHLDDGVKAELEKIARFEDRSPSSLASQAITALVEERHATRDLLKTGLAMVERQAASIPAEDIHNWLLADDDRPFPRTKTL